MAYDADLADQIGSIIPAQITDQDEVIEKRMFGGLAFLVNGHMALAVAGQGGLLLRVDPNEVDALVAEAGVSRAEMGSRTMNGWLRIDPSVIGSHEELTRWVLVGVTQARSLPPK